MLQFFLLSSNSALYRPVKIINLQRTSWSNLRKPPLFRSLRDTLAAQKETKKFICVSIYSNQGRWMPGFLTPRLAPQWFGTYQTLANQRTNTPVTDIKNVYGKASFICAASNFQLLWVWKRGRQFLKGSGGGERN